MPEGGGFEGGGGDGDGFGGVFDSGGDGDGGYYGGYSGDGKPDSVPKTVCVALSLCLVICIAILVIALPLLVLIPIYGGSIDGIATDFYSPGDSRLLSFSSFFCDGVNIEVDSQATGTSLALVDSPPPLTDQNRVNISDQRSLKSREYHFWQYHLYPNSIIAVSICTHMHYIDVYLVKGNSNVNKWGRSPSSAHAELFRPTSAMCPPKRIITYLVTEEDEYYVFLLATSRSIYSASLLFERFEYALPSGFVSLTDSCFAPSGGKCSVDIPYGTGSQLALVVATIPLNVDWGENVDLDISCNRRDWAYALVILLPLVVIAMIVCTVISICIHCCKKKKKATVSMST